MFDDHYIAWRQSRINTTLKYLQPSFWSTLNLLEIGCGYADVSNELFKRHLGLHSFTASEGSGDHVREMKKRQTKGTLANEINVFQHDCDQPWNPNNGSFDIIIHWGLLYHLKDPDSHLSDLLKYTKYMILETEVCDSDEPICKNTHEGGYDQALNGVGSRPSPVYIENVFKKNGFNFKRIDDAELNSSFHVYDWTPKNDGSYRNGIRRFWIAWREDTACPL